MSLSCGIIGLPNVGKSTLFNALCSRQVRSENFPFCTIQPNVGVVTVPDDRLDRLNACVQAKVVTPTTVTFVDIAGLVRGASKGEGLGNQFLATIREVDLLVHVVRCFHDDTIIHVAGKPDPCFEQEVIAQELRLADIASLNRKKQKIVLLLKKGNREALEENTALTYFMDKLEQNLDARNVPVTAQQSQWLKQWGLLTAKPVIYIANIDSEALQGVPNSLWEQFKQWIQEEKQSLISMCISLEAQISALPLEAQATFMQTYDLATSGLHQLITAAYQRLGLITYFTAGPKEVRAWTVAKGTLAPQAARVIHSDLEKNFIKAEVIKLADYLIYKREEHCRKAGKIAIQGKNYVVQDGDVIYFRCR